MKTTLKLIIALVLAGAGIGQAWANAETHDIGHITYTRGTDDQGTLSFYNSQGLNGGLSTGEALDANELQAVEDDKGNVVGYRVYIYAQPDAGYTVKGMTLEAELTTTVMQSRRNKAADSDASFDIGQKLTLTPVEGMPYIFEMVMPDDPNLSVTVTATFAPKGKNKEAVSYIDADGETQTKEAGTVYVLDGTEIELAGWYVCNSTLSYKGLDGMLKAEGDVHLILADGAEMSVEVDMDKAIDVGLNSLTIYGQSTGMDEGSLTVKGYDNGIGAIGNVTINGGVVNVNGSHNGIIAKNVNINGGKVTANGGNGYGIYGSGGDITLGWNSASGSVKASSYHISGTGSVKIAEGKVLKYTDGNSQTVTLRGTLDADAIAGIGNKYLTPYGYGGYCGKADVNGGKNVKWEIPLVDGAPGSTLTISGTGDMADYVNYNGNFAPWIKLNANGNASRGLKYESVTAVNIGDGVTSIGKNAFDWCYGLTSVTIGEDVTTIGESAFSGCKGLTSVTIGEGVTTIGEAAFMGCSGLTTINIPASVTNIDEGAFVSCFGLTSVNIPASVTTIGDLAFGNCGGLTTVNVNRYGSDITTLGEEVFNSCGKLTLILVPDEAAYDAYYKDSGWGYYKDKLAPQKLTVAKNASGWSTYCHRFPVTYSAEGVTAYIVYGLSEDGKSVVKEEAIVELEGNELAAAAPDTPLLLNYEGGEGSVILNAVPDLAVAVGEDDILSTGDDNCIISCNTTGRNLKHAAEDDNIPALTGVAGQTSYALYNGNFLRIDKDNGIDGHRCVLTVMGDASPDVIALTTAEVTTGTGGGIGRIVYSEGKDDNGELSFYKDEGLSGRLYNTGVAVSTEGLEVVKDDDGNVVGRRIYVYAHPDGGYTVNGMTLKAELTTSVQQSRRFDSDENPTLQIGRAIGLTPIEGKPYIFTMVMPNDPNLNVTVTATFKAKATNEEPISYIDADGATKEKEAGDVYVMDGTEEYLGDEDKDTWYVCESSIDYDRRLKAVGDVHLILADDATMNVVANMDNAIDLNQNDLTIYGQSGGAGSLIVTGGGGNGIGAEGTVTINGGLVDVYGNDTGIAAGNVTINGGSLQVFGDGGNGIGAGGTVTINGGYVQAAGHYGIRAGEVNINGGIVVGNGNGIYSDGDITLGWNSADDRVFASSYHISGTGSVKIADGKVLKYTDGNSQTVKLMGTLDAATIDAIKLKNLTPYGYSGYCGKADVNGGKNVVWEILAEDDAATTTIDESKTLNIIKNADVTGQTDFSMADYDNDDTGNFAPWIKPDADGDASGGLKYESVTAVNIGEGVTSIGQKAFDHCSGLTSVNIGEDVTNIGNYAFYCCGLTSVTIPASVANIGDYAFYDCVGLTSVNIPASVTTIGLLAFGGCGGLTTVNIPASVTTIGDIAFGGCSGLTTVTVNRYGSGITTLGNGVFDDCEYLKLILVPDEAAYNAYYGSSDDNGWGNYKDKLAPQTMTVAKNASGWGTYCHRFPVSYSLSDGAKAYTVTGLSDDGNSVEIEELAAAVPAKPLLLKYKGEGDVTLTAVPATATTIKEGVTDIMKVGQSNWIFSGNTTGSNLKHAAEDDDIPALTGVAGETSYALYNGNFLRIDTDNGIDAHRCVLTVEGAASPDVIALTTEVVTPGDDGGIGRIVYSQSHGTLSFYKDEGISDELDLDEDLSTEGLKEVKDDKEKVVGYRIYVYALPEFGYTVKDMTLQAELTTSVQQSRRFDSAETPTLKIGGAIELTPIEGRPYIFEMVMPNDPNINVTVTATFAKKATNDDAEIEYLDADGVKQTKEAGTVYVLDGTEYSLGVESKDTWYVCNSDLDYKHALWADGDVHLILADEAKMSVEGENGISFWQSLTIYGQSTGKDMGSLTTTGDGYSIGSNSTGSVTINGGEVAATGYHGIITGNVTINGGKVNATATGEYGYGIFSYGDITLGWNSATGSVTATSYHIDGTGSVKTADGKVLKYTDGNKTVTLRGTLDAAAIASKTLTPYGYGGYCGMDDPDTDEEDESKDVTWEIPLEDGAPVSTLNISGTGEMADYKNYDGDFAPWIKPNANGNASDGLKYESVTAVNIGDGVTYIGKNAFDWCYGLTSVTIGKGVTTIGENAFTSCGGLTTVNIPASVTEIGNGAFSGCGRLTTVTVNRYDSGITDLGNGVFDYGDKPKLILVPNEAAYDEYYKDSGWDGYKDKLAPQRMTLTKNDSGWGTYCHRFHVSYSVDGATAHTVAGLSEDGRSVSISSALAAVEPRTPLLLNYGSTGSVTLTADLTTVTDVEDGNIVSTGDTDEGFKFYGNPTADGLGANYCDFINEEGYNSYMLYDGEFVRIDENKGLAAHRCVLNVANGGDGEWAARVLTIADGEATGMGSLKRPTPDPSLNGGEWYDLSGRRINGQTVKKGVYINNGRKVVIK